ncbi:hypothetical protein J5J83_13440 [Azoarcus sp. L1K30]|uniref:hypothetical protein n=1 Tax=Azoarcus sp. L1K30 TaxID=2820277 RepID=UPI001B83CEE4|nr:hypothetical protein [Azoarcus sp. L1K30]MBR0567121.1 hypothetical protein [Azoarcus sp. L1K30]
MSVEEAMKDELTRICRVSDMLCTGHAALRDRYAKLAFALDLFTLGVSTWLVALAFVEPKLNGTLTPFGWDSQIWVGALGTGVFFLTLIQMKTDWKGRSDAHKRTLDVYAEVKREAGYLLSAGEYNHDACQRVFSRYDMAASVGVQIPESEFLSQKQRHLVKVALSKVLDDRPATSLMWLRVRLWWRDTFKADK